MSIEQQTVPFSKLVAPDEINARPKTREGLEQLAASIERHGLIQPLAVRKGEGGKFEIIAGRRRHAAIAHLVKSKVLEKDCPVPVIVRDEDDATALETSYVENAERLPPHPVDQHDVFVRLAEEHGLKNADIAAHFGISERTVRQQLALGKLAKPIRDAYRKGSLDAKSAQAFTRVEDPEVQIDVFERLRKRGKHYLQEQAIRQELSDDRETVDESAWMKFVGEEAYIAGGGKISDDLFEEARLIDDMQLLKKLARQKLDAECKRLKADGWKWVEGRLDDRDGDFQVWSCDSIKGDDGDWEMSAEEFSPTERKKSGVLVEIDGDGKLEFSYGLIKPKNSSLPSARDGDEFDQSDDAGDDEEPDGDGSDFNGDHDKPSKDAHGDVDAGPYALSSSLTASVTTQLTVAAAKTLAQDPALALRVIAAAIVAAMDSPAEITNRGHTSVRGNAGDRVAQDFGKEFKRLSALSGEALDRAFAVAAATTLDLVSFNSYSPHRSEAAGHLIPALIGSDFLEQARLAFDASDYFLRAKKDAAIEALEEMRPCVSRKGTALASRQVHAGLKKAELAALATRLAKEHGWLPPELRHPSYELEAGKPAIAGKKRKAA